MNVQGAVEEGSRKLPRRRGLPDPLREARWLLAAAWGVDEVWLRVHGAEDLPGEVAARYLDWLERRASGIPAHHLTGTCSFWGYELHVSPAVLVPRPETELLVEAALELPTPDGAKVLDVGTGSGCIAIALAGDRPQWRVAAVDRSLAALQVAKRNRLTVGSEIEIFQGHLADAVGASLDLVTANLPYIPTSDLEALPVEVRHDPVAALDGGADGLDLVRLLVADLARVLSPGAWSLLEIGERQTRAVAEIADQHGLVIERTITDLGGIERVVLLRNATRG